MRIALTPGKSRYRLVLDVLSRRSMLVITGLCALLVIVIGTGLLLKSLPLLEQKSVLELLFSSTWSPENGLYGFWPFIAGTFWVTFIAMVIAVPLCLLTSIYLAEYARPRVRGTVKPLIDLLAGIPSVVFGLMGVLVLVPLVRGLASAAGSFSTGYSILTAGIVLAMMVFPVIISISEEVIRTVPHGMREAALSLGATRWQAVKLVVFRGALPGITAAIILGFSRAFGETMAVLMVVGNVATVPNSIFSPAYPLPALLANNYGEMMSVPMYDSALMFSALILLVMIFLFNIAARLILRRVERSYGQA